jgi:hypothetical protein
MDTEHPTIHNSSKTEIVKDVTAIPPYVHASIFSLTLVIEPVHLSDLSRFMIASDQSDSIGISDLQEQ